MEKNIKINFLIKIYDVVNRHTKNPNVTKKCDI